MSSAPICIFMPAFSITRSSACCELPRPQVGRKGKATRFELDGEEAQFFCALRASTAEPIESGRAAMRPRAPSGSASRFRSAAARGCSSPPAGRSWNRSRSSSC
jgi:hypothetical protein